MQTALGQNTEIRIKGAEDFIETELTKVFDEDGLQIYDIVIHSKEELLPRPIKLEWKVPAVNVKGVWKPTTDFSKRIQADWEMEHMESRISIDAPVISIFGHDDVNMLTFACSDAISTLEMNARLREEDNNMYCHITFFTERHYPLKEFKAQLRLDYRAIHFSKTLKAVSEWWEGYANLKPTYVPLIAKTPLYSTWYQFHQNLDESILLKELETAYKLGYEVVIIDDGWQTNDSNRGYDFTGDWEAERIPEMAAFVAKIHALGMKAALWYSVPFCGKKSKAYQRFKGKFLTEDHRWAPVFDPRYPEVRSYLIAIYTKALTDWNLDGFKLDFIDDFHWYADTPLYREDVMDYASINDAVDRLMTDVMKALQTKNSEVFIEFRQKYTGPAMRKYGNMFRAFDCPGDATMNRVRIADIKMLCGNTAVHSDMVTWHPNESLEMAALQLINTLFGVPQLSILLNDIPASHQEMVAFYTAYWNANKNILLEGDFTPYQPLANYPIKKVSANNHQIMGVYDSYIVPIENDFEKIHLLNANLGDEIVVRTTENLGNYNGTVYDCSGTIVSKMVLKLYKGVTPIKVPPCGIIKLKKQL